MTIALPAAYQQLQSAFHSIHTDLEDASRILGSSRLHTLMVITAPLLRTSVLATSTATTSAAPATAIASALTHHKVLLRSVSGMVISTRAAKVASPRSRS